MIISDSTYCDSFESTGSAGSAGTFGPAPGQPRIALTPAQLDWNSTTIQIATIHLLTSIGKDSQLIDMMNRLEKKVDQMSSGLTKDIKGVEGRITAHATKIVSMKADIDAHNNTVLSEINGVRDEMQGMEKRLSERLDGLTIMVAIAMADCCALEHVDKLFHPTNLEVPSPMLYLPSSSFYLNEWFVHVVLCMSDVLGLASEGSGSVKTQARPNQKALVWPRLGFGLGQGLLGNSMGNPWVTTY
ncbi:uncharacterized protein F5147DRAFT_656213 [Suillus discolor]|uniref:Uncharacterized protein n=1 Tax=Suillus discolor TaxID=1912936 RepID=A0A9P7JQG3_9AGAM|nr:uncharacterized protein F5147DRAFT_656213 [Suillus discolor]KAG2097975.1 hypothetical protein F5147DRAFT_656213 [Suillus discolor]